MATFAAAAVLAAVTIAGCGDVQPSSPPTPTFSASPVPANPCSEGAPCFVPFFICIGGSDCHVDLSRGKSCPDCGPTVFDYRIEVVRTGDANEIETGQVAFAAGAATATIHFQASAAVKEVHAELSFNGSVIRKQTIIAVAK